MKTLAVLIAVSAFAGTISLEPTSKLWVEGTSTVRDWRCEAGAIESKITTAATGDLAGVVEAARVTIPVARLDCRNGKMNDHMWKALNSKEHANVVFDLRSYTVTGGKGVLKAALTIAGTTKNIEIPATVDNDGDVVRVKASPRIDMTQWGVKPPSLMMGAMKVNQEVTINFDVSLKPY